jgi:hypothetical protein
LHGQSGPFVPVGNPPSSTDGSPVEPERGPAYDPPGMQGD